MAKQPQIMTILPQAVRTGRTITSSQVVPANQTGVFNVLSDIGAADLADPSKWVRMFVQIQDATAPGGWRDDAGCAFQCGPVTHRDGTVNAAGENRGFNVDTAEVSGKTIRGVLDLFQDALDGAAATMTAGIVATLL